VLVSIFGAHVQQNFRVGFPGSCRVYPKVTDQWYGNVRRSTGWIGRPNGVPFQTARAVQFFWQAADRRWAQEWRLKASGQDVKHKGGSGCCL